MYKRNLSYWEANDFPHSVQEFYEETFRRLRGRWKLAKTVEDAEKDILEMDEQLRRKVKSENLKAVMSNQTNCVRLSSSSSRSNSKGGKKGMF